MWRMRDQASRIALAATLGIGLAGTLGAALAERACAQGAEAQPSSARSVQMAEPE